MRSTRRKLRGINGAPTPVSKDKMIKYHFIKAKSTKQGVLGVSVSNDAKRLCDLTLEPWTHCIREAYIGKRGDGTCNQNYKRNQHHHHPERQIQSQLRTMFQLIMVRK